MSFLQLQNYLTFLLDKNIIEETTAKNGNGTENKIYINTEKGNNLLDDIEKLFTYFE